MELNFWLSTFGTMTTQSALLTGRCNFSIWLTARNRFLFWSDERSRSFFELVVANRFLDSDCLFTWIWITLHYYSFSIFNFWYTESSHGWLGLKVDGHCSWYAKAQGLPYLLLLLSPDGLLFRICLYGIMGSLSIYCSSFWQYCSRNLPLFLYPKWLWIGWTALCSRGWSSQ